MVAGPLRAQEPLRYDVEFLPELHSIQVTASVPTGGKPSIELKMAVWTAYVVREYSQFVVQISAERPAGPALSIYKTRKNRWAVETGGAPRVLVRYRVYSHAMHVQDNYVDSEFALLNGQPSFLTLAENAGIPHEVKLILPPAWKTSLSAMRKIGEHQYRAKDYEELMDSPIVAGNPVVHEFAVDGKKHRLVNVLDRSSWDVSKSTADLAKIVAAERDVWGSLPYREYTFFNILSSKGGGMEHAECTVMMAAPNATRRRDTYVAWLSLTAHELFHAWNVKRLRPREIVPGEYEVEQYTRSLGIAEGFTSYYAYLAMRRAGVISDGEFYELLSREIDALQRSDGRRLQSLADASFDAWIKFYRPNEITNKTTISYYTKGAVVAFLLDARLRAQSNNARSLDTVMREMLQRYPQERGYTLEEFAEVAQTDLRPWFQSTDELDYSEAARWFGLKISSSKVEPAGNNANREIWLRGGK